jgi:hypothetical protein
MLGREEWNHAYIRPEQIAQYLILYVVKMLGQNFVDAK